MTTKTHDINDLLQKLSDQQDYIFFLDCDRRNWFGLCQALARVIINSEIDAGFLFDEAKCKSSEAPDIFGGRINTQRMYNLGDMKVYSVGIEIPDALKGFEREEIGRNFFDGLKHHVINGRLKDGFE